MLSRGYGRRRVEPGVVVVSDGEHVTADLDRSGDEPLLIKRRVPRALVLVAVVAVSVSVAGIVVAFSAIVVDEAGVAAAGVGVGRVAATAGSASCASCCFCQ